MSLRLIKIDTEDLKKQFKQLGLEVEKRINEELALLAASAHNRIVERAQNELHSSRKQYIDHLKTDFTSEFATWVITLEDEADWIEDGLPKDFDMKPGLLNGKSSHVAKDGHRYAIVPFKHSRGPKNMDKNSRDLLAQVKRVLRKEGIKMGPKGLVKGADGNPKVGLIRRIDIEGTTSHLKGLAIYQQVRKDRHGKNFVNQEIMTFRTVTDKQGKDKWVHPGSKGHKFFDEAYEWAMKEWETAILPRLQKEFEGT